MLLVNSNGIVAIYAYAWYEWPYHTRTIVPYAYSRTVAYVPYAYDMKYAYGTQQNLPESWNLQRNLDIIDGILYI